MKKCKNVEFRQSVYQINMHSYNDVICYKLYKMVKIIT